MISRRTVLSSIAFGATTLVAGASMAALPALAGNGNGNGNGDGNGHDGKYPHRNRHRRNRNKRARD